MLRYILLGTFAITGVAIATPTSAYAQETEQTDQSEEDWRNSRRKRKSNDDFDPITNPSGLGSGINLPPLEPIDTLPEDSRRHLQRQRAKVIAELGFGEDPADIPFEPSDAAKNDPSLAAEEEEAWEVILTDLQGSTGGDQQGEGGPNKVAVAGRGGGTPGSVTRGGSAQSAADILAQLKGLQAGNGRVQSSGGGNGSAPQSTQTGSGQSTQGAPQTGGQQGQTQQQGQSSQSDGQQGQAPQQAQANQGASQQEGSEGQGQATNERNAGANGKTGDQQGQSESQAQAQNNGGGEGQDGSDAGTDGTDTGSDGNGAEDGSEGEDSASDSRTPHTPTVDPLNLPERPSTLGDGRGASSSASDYLKGVTGQSAPETED